MTAPSALSTRRDEERILVLDVLRGIALLGMFLVHFSIFASGGGRADAGYQKFVALFMEERFWTIFAILFGVGFAIQLFRTETRGESFVPRYLRRLGALMVFGFLAHALFGFNVLLGYAVWGIPLLLVRRWSNRTLLIATMLSAMSASIFMVSRAVYGVATRGEEAYRIEMNATRAKNRAFNQENHAAQEAESYASVVKARLQHMRWFYAQWFSFLPVNTFTLFLLGMLAFRLGLFDRPEEHRRLIAGLMVFGVAAWGLETWLFTRPSELASPLVRNLGFRAVAGGMGLVRGMWLAFAYMGGVLLLVAGNPRWLQRLSVFGWTGRMALTNYIVQVAILDLTFSKYALGLSVTPLVGSLLAIALFLADAVLSRWWLARFRYGPMEWLWRSITQAQLQRMVRSTPTAALSGVTARAGVRANATEMSGSP